MERGDTVRRVIEMRRQSPTLSATAIAEMTGVSVARASKILRDANLPRQSVAERQRQRRAEKAQDKTDRESRAVDSALLSCPTPFAGIVRGLGLSLDEAARLIGRDSTTVRTYCRGRVAPKHVLNLAYLALALGPERTRELIGKGRKMAEGIVAKIEAENISRTPVDTTKPID